MSLLSRNRFLCFASPIEMWKCEPGAGAIRERLGHERAHHPHRTRDLGGRHLEQRVVVGGRQAIAVDEIDLELAVRILVIDLVDVEPGLLQRRHQPLEELAAAGEALVVVAGLVERIGGVEWRERTVAAPLEQHEFRLDAGVHRPSRALRASSIARAARRAGSIRTACRAHGRRRRCAHSRASKARSVSVERSPIAMYSGPCGPMPRPQIANPAKPAPVVSSSSKCATGNALRLRRAVDVDELRQDELDLVLLEKSPCLGCGHSYGSSTRQKSSQRSRSGTGHRPDCRQGCPRGVPTHETIGTSSARGICATSRRLSSTVK